MLKSNRTRTLLWTGGGLLLAALLFFIPEDVYARLDQTISSLTGPYWNFPLLTLGQFEVTPSFMVKSILYIMLMAFGAGLVSRFLLKRVLVHFPFDEGKKFAISRVAGYIFFAGAIVVGLQGLGANLNSLAVLGGAIGIGVGLGLQTIAENFVSGVILLMERPIKVGDRVEVDGLNGDVINIAGRSTWVRTNDNVLIIIPNSEFINRRVINWTANDRRVRFPLKVGVSYGSDPEKVRRLLLEVASRNSDVLTHPAADVLFKGFGDSSLDFELRVWTESRVQTPHILKSDLYFEIFKVFGEHGVEIPFPQRDLHVRSVAAGLGAIFKPAG
ncbi:MAG: mechanosensitive ion channel [Acidobacteria bacterium]|nr:mechanosensitive ion channel [Acidobacteriota bacterium]